jgi:Tol biopolymer transport system component
MHRTKGFWTILVALLFSLGAAIGVNAFTGQTTRVSASSAGVPANAGATNAALSADGRYVVFQSSSTNLVAGAAGTQVYRHDRVTGTTELVSVNKLGGASALPSRDPSVSADGRYVVFDSFASDLADGDTNGTVLDIYVRDMQLAATKLVSASALGVVGDKSSILSGLSGAHAISDDGRYVVFISLATNLLAEPFTGTQQQIYVKDVSTGAIVRASLNEATGATAGDLMSITPVISGNGRFVAFASLATNLSADSTSGIASQVFVRDLVAGTTTLESPGTAAVTKAATLPTLSFDGRFLAFVAAAPLEPRDLDNGTEDVYLRDRTADTLVLASLSPNAVQGARASNPSISGDGRWVAFESPDETMVTPDTNVKIPDVFLYDRDSQAVTIVSLNDADEQATTSSFGASLSADGHAVLFGSAASNLVTSPSSTGVQLYVRTLVSNQAPVLPALGRDYALLEAQPMHLAWEFSDSDASTSWTATVDYGDGAGARPLALNANKTFSLDHLWAPGAYDVAIVVTDDAGAAGSLVIHVVVTNVAPSIGLLPAVNLAFTRTLDTSGTFTDPGSSETYSATVSYGDGTPVQALAIGPYSAPPLAAGSFALRHSYAAGGSYTVAVTVSDGRGGSTTAAMLVNVSGYSYEWFSSFSVGRTLPVKFTVRGPDGAFVLDRSVRVDVVDAAGNVVVGPYLYGDQPSRSVTASGDSYHVNVDARDLGPGAYWLRVQFSSPALTGGFTLGTTGASSTHIH